VWLLVLWLWQRPTKRSTNHGRERLGKQIDRHLEAHESRHSSVSLLRMEGKIGMGHRAWETLLSQSLLIQ
jgi:hypothetical protein